MKQVVKVKGIVRDEPRLMESAQLQPIESVTLVVSDLFYYASPANSDVYSRYQVLYEEVEIPKGLAQLAHQ